MTISTAIGATDWCPTPQHNRPHGWRQIECKACGECTCAPTPQTTGHTTMAAIQRFAHEFQKNSGSREMVENPDGEWMRYEDYYLASSGLLDHIKALAGLIQLVCGNPDMPAGMRDILLGHWRYTEAMELLSDEKQS